MDDEVGHEVRVFLAREDAEDVSDDLHDGPDQNSGEIPRLVSNEEAEVGNEADGEQDDTEDTNGE